MKPPPPSINLSYLAFLSLLSRSLAPERLWRKWSQQLKQLLLQDLRRDMWTVELPAATSGGDNFWSGRGRILQEINYEVNDGGDNIDSLDVGVQNEPVDALTKAMIEKWWLPIFKETQFNLSSDAA
nr:hypothetical protein Iba_chr13dCG9630 [Ipomoea batatas]